MPEDLTGPEDTVTIDRKAQQIAYICWRRDQDDEIVTTTELREQLGLDQNKPAHSRLKGDLSDAGITEHAGTRPSGGPIPVDCWTITEQGRSWVVDNIESIAPPQTLDEACEQISMLADRVEDLEERIEKVHGAVGWDKKRLQRLEDRMDALESDQEQVKDWILTRSRTHRDRIGLLFLLVDELQEAQDLDSEINHSDYIDAYR
jgi:archaellum component FlaC